MRNDREHGGGKRNIVGQECRPANGTSETAQSRPTKLAGPGLSGDLSVRSLLIAKKAAIAETGLPIRYECLSRNRAG
jgi:hypothetical protein